MYICKNARNEFVLLSDEAHPTKNIIIFLFLFPFLFQLAQHYFFLRPLISIVLLHFHVLQGYRRDGLIAGLWSVPAYPVSFAFSNLAVMILLQYPLACARPFNNTLILFSHSCYYAILIHPFFPLQDVVTAKVHIYQLRSSSFLFKLFSGRKGDCNYEAR